ncbi:hypothetical protein CWI39_0241p0020 [Hamiltosporidium magnivora]|uniref:Uncharacterized protein n=1 Tax=Hamiltosporidium magnivora TaxID=148818 RepID=A0A4Q9LII8_9MICR|nr:hypothetical protein CWI39_0241p0020 [Hamiltosporidium magnivora]
MKIEELKEIHSLLQKKKTDIEFFIEESITKNLKYIKIGLQDYESLNFNNKWKGIGIYLLCIHKILTISDNIYNIFASNFNKNIFCVSNRENIYNENKKDINEYLKALFCFHNLLLEIIEKFKNKIEKNKGKFNENELFKNLVQYLSSKGKNLFQKKSSLKKDDIFGTVDSYINILNESIILKMADTVVAEYSFEKNQYLYNSFTLSFLRNDICRTFEIKDMNFFIFKKKLNLILKQASSRFNLPLRDLEILNSYGFMKKNSDLEIINIGDILDDRFKDHAKYRIDRFTSLLYTTDIQDINKALMVSYICNICPCLIDLINIDYFDSKYEVYYVKWIHNYKNTDS